MQLPANASTRTTLRLPLDSSLVGAPSTGARFMLEANRGQVAGFAREDDDLLIQLTNGNTIRITGFFVAGGAANELVLATGDMLRVDFSHAMTRGGDGIEDGLVTFHPLSDADSTGVLLAALGLLSGAVVATQVWKKSRESDTTPPAAPDAMLTAGSSAAAPAIAPSSVTRVAAPWLIGKDAEPNSTVIVQVDDQAPVTLRSGADGTWQHALPTLADGQHKIVMTQVDDASNRSDTRTLDFQVDTTPPAVPVLADTLVDAGTNGGTSGDPSGGIDVAPRFRVSRNSLPRLRGFTEARAQVTIYDNGVPVGSTTASDTGEWSFDVTTPLTDGAHAITAMAVDAVGNESAVSRSLDVVIDTAAPGAAEMQTIDNVSPIEGSIAADGITNDATPTLVGTAEANAKVSIFDNGVLLGTTTTVANGTWQYTVPALGDGAHRLTTTVTDAAGNTGPESAPIAFNVDTQAPGTPGAAVGYADDAGALLAPLSTAATTDDTRPGLQVGAGLQDAPALYVDGVRTPATYDPAAGTLTPDAPITEGAHTLTHTLTDAAGNESAPSPALALGVDTAAPTTPAALQGYVDDVAPVIELASTAATTNDAQPGIQVGANLADTPTLYVNGVKTAATYNRAAGTLTPDAPLADGTHAVTITLTDAAGNESAPSPALNLGVDTAAPATPAAPQGYADDVAPVIDLASTAATTNDARPGIQVGANSADIPALYINGVKTAATYDKAAGTLTPDAPLADGTHAVTVTLTDTAGNESAPSAALTVAIDTVSPITPTAPAGYADDVLPVIDVASTAATTNDARPGIQVGANLADIPILYVDDVKTAASYDPAAGTLTPDAPLADGTHAVTVTLTDAAGNESARSPAMTLGVDTAAPTTPTAPAGYADDVAPVIDLASTAATTNDARPGIQVGANLTDTPILYVNGTKTPATYDKAAGTLTPDAPLADGTHAVTVTLTDTAGNESGPSPALALAIDTVSPTEAVVITRITDDTAPSTGTIAHGGTTNDTRPLLAGTLSTPMLEGERVQILRNGAEIGLATVGGTGTDWTYLDADLADGQRYAYTARVIDAAGNLGAVSRPYEVRIDGTAPSQTVTITALIDDVTPIAGPLADGGLTNDAQPEIIGSISAALADNEVVAIYRDGTRIGAVTPNGTRWTYADNGLTDGAVYLYTARVEDAAGNVGAESAPFRIGLQTRGSSTTVTIDAVNDDQAPRAGTVANGGYSNDTMPTLLGGLSAALVGTEQVIVLRDGVVVGPATVSGTTWTYADSPQADGSAHSYTAMVIDAAGNRGAASNPYTLHIDTSAPAKPAAPTHYVDDITPVTDTASSAAVTNDARPGLQIGANLTDMPTLYVNGTPTAATYDKTAGTLTPDLPLADGQSRLTFTLTDAAGNESAASEALVLGIDTLAPTQTAAIGLVTDDVAPNVGTVAPGASTNDTSPTLSGLLSAPLNAGESVQVLRDGVVVGTASVATGTLEWSYADRGLADGSHPTYSTRVVDAAGNLGAASANVTLTIDTTAPAQATTISAVRDDAMPTVGDLASGSTTNDSRPELVGTVSGALANDEVVAIYRNAVKVGVATTIGMQWTFTDSGLVNGGQYAYTARVEDAAGNAGTPSNAFDLTIQTLGSSTQVRIDTIDDDALAVVGAIANDGYTNDTTPRLAGSLSGRLAAGETLRVMRDAVAIGNAVVTGTTWTYTDTALASGQRYEYTAVIVDGAGNLGTVSGAYAIRVDTDAPAAPTAPTSYVDDVAPVLGNASRATSTNDARPGVQVGTNLADTPTLYVNGVKVPAAYDAAAGTLTPATAVADGNADFTFALTDAAGNEGRASPALGIRIDTVAPDQTVVIQHVTDDAVPALGHVGSDGFTNDTSPQLSGTVSAALKPGETLEILRNHVVIGSATMSGSAPGTSWAFQDAGLADGQRYAYTARVIDAAGNVGAESASYVVNIDAAAPQQQITITAIVDDVAPSIGTLADGEVTNDARPEIVGTLTNALAANESVALYRDDVRVGVASVNGTTWSHVDGGLTDGSTYRYTARVEDAAGNAGASSRPFTVSVRTAASATGVTITSITDDQAPQTGVIAHNGSTNDASPLLAGTVTTALKGTEKLVVQRDGLDVGTATVIGTDWTYADSGLSANAAYRYTAVIVDAAGNRGNTSNVYAIQLDTTAPVQTLRITGAEDDAAPVTGAIAADSVTNDDTPLIRGTLSEALVGTDKVEVLRNGRVVGDATVTGTTWSYTDASLASGSTYTYSAHVIDAAGNVSTLSNTLRFSINTAGVNQSTTILGIMDDQPDQLGTVDKNGYTNDTSPTLSGSINTAMAAGDVVQVLRNGTVAGAATVTGTTWTYTDANLMDGQQYTYTARVVNSAGTEGAPGAPYALRVDTAAPTASTTLTGYADDQPAQTGLLTFGTPTNDLTPLIHGTVSATLGANEHVVVYRDGIRLGEAQVSNGAWTFQDSGLSNGSSYRYTAQVEDAAGNKAALSAVSVLTVDTTAPATPAALKDYHDDVAPVTSLTSTAAVTNDARPGVNVGANLSDTPALYVNGNKTPATYDKAAGTLTPDAPLAEGAHVLTYTLTDAAGNESARPATLSVTIDTTAPLQSVVIGGISDDTAPQVGTVPNGGYTNDAAPVLNGTISLALASGERLQVLRDGGAIGIATVTGTTWTFADSALSDGQRYAYTARVIDAAGNVGAISSEYGITLDSTPPSQRVTITTIVDDLAPSTGDLANNATTNDSQPEIRGSVSASLAANEVVAVYRDDARIGTAALNGTNWSYTDSGLANGSTYRYTARVEDGAGNTGAISAAHSITIQTSGSATGVTITSITDDQAPQTGVVAHNGATNDTSPSLAGTLSAPLAGTERVVVLRDGVDIGTATAAGTTWTFTDSGLVSDKRYSYTAVIVDAAGNRGTASNVYAIQLDTAAPTQTLRITGAEDNAAPVTGSIAADSVTNDDTPLVRGTLSQALSGTEKIEVLRNGQVVGEAVVADTGWTYSDAGLASGSTYTYGARVVDAAGNVSTLSNTLRFSINTAGVNQSATILGITDDRPDQLGNVDKDGHTNDTSPTLNGSINAALVSGDSVQVLRNGAVAGTATVTGTTWTFTDANLADGQQYTYTARVVNSAGAEGAASAPYAIRIDTAAPTATAALTGYTDDQPAQTGALPFTTPTNDLTPLITGNVVGAMVANEHVVVYRDGVRLGAALLTNGSWTFQDSGLSSGVSYRYTAQVEDASGNKAPLSVASVLTVDTTAPSRPSAAQDYKDDIAPVLDAASTATTTNDPRPGINVGTNLADTPTLYVDGVRTPASYDPVAGTLTPNAPVVDGAHAFTHTLTDAAGNESPASGALTFTVQTTASGAPAAPSMYDDDVAPILNASSTAATTNDARPGIQVGVNLAQRPTLYVDGNRVSATYDPAKGTLTPDAAVKEGTRAFTYTLTNAAGNESPASAPLPVVIDTTAPLRPAVATTYDDDVAPVRNAASTAPSTNDTRPGIQVGSNLADTPALYVDGVRTPATYDRATGTLTPDVALAEGSHVLSHTLTDAAGNESVASSGLALVVDTTAPATPAAPTDYLDDVAPVSSATSKEPVTNDARPGINIGVNLVDRPTLYVDGVRTVATYDASTGTLTPDAPVAEGVHAYRVTLTDAAGNESAASAALTLTVDTTAPTQSVVISRITDDAAPRTGTIANGGYSNDTTPGLAGTLSNALAGGESLQILRNGTAIGTATVIGTGWTFADSALADGQRYTYIARVVDAAGNIGAVSSDYVIHLDGTAPSQTVTVTAVVDDIAPSTGNIAHGGTTNDSQPDIVGSLSAALAANEVVAVYRNDVRQGVATLNGTNWSYADSGLSNGTTYRYTAQVEDLAGNVGPTSNALAVTLQTSGSSTRTTIVSATDDQAPLTGFVAHNGTTNDTSPVLAGTLSTALAGTERVMVLRDGSDIGTATVTGTDWTFADSGLSANKAYSYTTVVVDAADNRGTASNVYTLQLDTAAPTQTVLITGAIDNAAPVTGTIPENGITNDDTPMIRGTISQSLTGTETIEVLRNSQVVGTASVIGTSWTYLDAGLASGSTYTYSARVIDAAGNVSTPSNTLRFSINTAGVNQSATILGVLDNQPDQLGNVEKDAYTNDTSPTLNGSLNTALPAGDSLQVLRDGAVVGTATVTDTTWVYTDANLSGGKQYTYTVRVVNSAGSEGATSAPYAIRIDTEAPAAGVTLTGYTDDQAAQTGDFTFTTPTNDVTPLIRGGITGTLAANEHVVVYRDDARIGVAVHTNGTWTFQDAGLTHGARYRYTAQVEDAAGNKATLSTASVLTVDTTAPATPATLKDYHDDVAPVVSLNSTAAVTNDARPGINVGANLTDTPTLYVDGNRTPATYDKVTGTLTSDAALSQGAHVVTHTLTDAAGNESGPSTALAITVDTTTPSQTVAITGVSDDVAPRQGIVSNGSHTNDTAPTLAGTLTTALATGEVVQVLRNADVVGVATVTGTTWTYADTGLADAQTYTYTARVIDLAGNGGTLSQGYVIHVDTARPVQTVAITTIVDDVAPSAGNLRDGDITNDSRPEVRGTVSSALADNEVVAVYRDGTRVGTATMTGNTWAFADSGLVNGATHRYIAQVEDAAGNIGTASAPFSITVQTSGSSTGVSIVSIADDQQPQTGTVAHNGVTNDTSPLLTGALTAALAGTEQVHVLRDTVDIGVATVNGRGWTFADSGLSNGSTYTYSAVIIDNAGNRGTTSNDHTITVDTAQPAYDVTISRILDDKDPQTGVVAANGVTNDTSPTLEGTVSAALRTGESLQVLRDGLVVGAASVTGTGWSYTDAGLAEGTRHVYTARVVDAAGNLGATSSGYAIRLDTATPLQRASIGSVDDDVAPGTGAVASGAFTNDRQPVVNGSLTAPLGTGERLQVLRDGIVIGNATLDTTAPDRWTYADAGLIDGRQYTYTARVIDEAGNVGSTSSTYVINVDATAPAKPTAPTSYNDDIAPVTDPRSTAATTNDPRPGLNVGANRTDTVRLYVDGVLTRATYDAATGTLTPDADLSGSHAFSYTLVDAAMNESDRSDALTIDIVTANPVTPVIRSVADDTDPGRGTVSNGAYTNDVTPTLSGTLPSALRSGDIVQVLRNGNVVGIATVPAATPAAWSYADSGLSNGNQYTYTTRVVDAAGNIGNASPDYVIHVDTTAPVKPAAPTSYNDDTAPVIDARSTAATTNDSRLGINVGANLTDTPVLYVDGRPVSATYDRAAGTLTPDADLVGQHAFRYTLRDAASNESEQSDALTINIVTTAPIVPTIQRVADDLDPIKTDIANGGATNDTTPTLSGTAAANVLVTVYDNGRPLGSSTSDANGAWRFTPPSALSGSDHRFTVTGTDAAGNTSDPSAAFAIVLDTAAPVTTARVTSITTDAGISANDFITNDGTLVFSGTLSQSLSAGERVQISLDGGGTWKDAAVNGTTWSFDNTSSTLTEGRHTVQARVVDAAGNVGPGTSQDVTTDYSAPGVAGMSTSFVLSTDTADGLDRPYGSTITATNTDLITRDVTLSIRGELSQGLKTGEYFQLSSNGGGQWTTVLQDRGTSWTHALPDAYRASDRSTYSFRIIDAAGNVAGSTALADRTVVVDLVAPSVIAKAPVVTGNVTTATLLNFDSATYGTAEAGTKVALINDLNGNGSYQEGVDEILAFTTAAQDGSWSMSTTLTRGAKNLAFQVFDAAGNYSDMTAGNSIGVTEGSGSRIVVQNWGGTTDADTFGLSAAAVTLGTNGLWSFAQSVRAPDGGTANAVRVYDAQDLTNYNAAYLPAPARANGSGFGRFVNSMVFADFDRDGFSDVISQVSDYGSGSEERTAMWRNNGNGSYTPLVIEQGTLNHLGGVIAYDKEGDGYLDLVLADSQADSLGFVKNRSSFFTPERSGGGEPGVPFGVTPGTSVIHEVGAVDIDNNGSIDVSAHTDVSNLLGTEFNTESRTLTIFVNNKGNFDRAAQQNYLDVFLTNGQDDRGNLSQSMTWADFNGDGWLDLYINRGYRFGGDNSLYGERNDSNESRIYYNDGRGALKTGPADVKWLGDALDGGTSLAVDWNHDGKMDVIEVPRQQSDAVHAFDRTNPFSPTLYTNAGGSFAQSSLTGSTIYNDITGAVALDYDWDGSMDVVLYRAGVDQLVGALPNAAPTQLVKNTNIAADGTSLQIRILDGEGINTYYSNTVKLYDSTGKLVATQLINPQASGSSNSMGLVSFFGLSATEAYTVQLLRLTNGATDHVSGVASIGGYTNTTVNSNWTGLTTGKSHDAYVLTAEADGAVNTRSTPTIGTGYNDTFFASAGDDTYNGSGGWSHPVVSPSVWSATGGADLIDYGRAASAITANLTTGKVTGSSTGTDTLVNIEMLAGTAYADTITDGAGDNRLEGRGGNDRIVLSGGGRDTLLYRLLSDADATGGNGADTIDGFTLGPVAVNDNADQIDLSKLLSAHQGSLGVYRDSDSGYHLDAAAEPVKGFLSTRQEGGNTVISVDRDGGGTNYGFTDIVTLNNVRTDLETLLANQQIVI